MREWGSTQFEKNQRPTLGAALSMSSSDYAHFIEGCENAREARALLFKATLQKMDAATKLKEQNPGDRHAALRHGLGTDNFNFIITKVVAR